MKSTKLTRAFAFLAALFALSFNGVCAQDDAEESKQEVAEETVALDLAEGTLQMKAPVAWKSVEPKFNMIEAEFQIPKSDGEDVDGRLTIMPSGGGVEGNIDRWKGQFSQPGGGAASEAKVEVMEVSGMKVHVVDLSGSYADRPDGPSSPPIIRENYRMLAAIVETENAGMYFIKFYGDGNTVEANAKRFETFVKSLTVVD